MNKEEIQKELVRARAAETIIKNNIIELLVEQLVEAEKPKIRHGDFGPNVDGNDRIVLFQNGKGGGQRDDYGQLGIHSDTDIKPFGNIFDLLKEWGEDLKKWERQKDRNKFYFRICGGTIDFHTNKYCSFSLTEAEEIWHKLGQMIATFKRKQSQK